MNSGFFLVEDANGNPYDTIELINLKGSDSIEKASFLYYQNKEISRQSYSSRTFDLFENIIIKPNVEIVYLLPRANRYSLPSLLSRYTVNPDIAYSPAGSNFKYYVKLTFLALGIVSLVFALGAVFLLTKNMLRKKQCAAS